VRVSAGDHLLTRGPSLAGTRRATSFAYLLRGIRDQFVRICLMGFDALLHCPHEVIGIHVTRHQRLNNVVYDSAVHRHPLLRATPGLLSDCCS
jgi:hypothetical protein